MADEERRLRADAERNRRRLLDAAQILFREQGLEVGVGEIAKRAGVGRGTLFRNFPSKEHLVAAIVAERMRDAAVRGKELTHAEDPGGALFEFLEEIVGRQQVDRGLFEAVAEDFLANDEIREAYEEVVDTLDQLVARAKKVGAVREDVCGIDVLMMVKGVCESATAFSHINPRIVERQLDLVRAAISVPAASEPLRGPAPTVEDMALAFAGDPPATERGRARS
jgi:AcrR family transcriptional regulator